MNRVGEQTVDMCGGAGLVTGNPTQHQTWHWTCAAAAGWPGMARSPPPLLALWAECSYSDREMRIYSVFRGIQWQ